MTDYWYKILYGGAHFHYFKCDCVLSFFQNADHIGTEVLYMGNPPSEMTSVIEFLASEGMIKVNQYGASITEKGKGKRDSGGYKRQAFKERITWFSVVIGIIVGITGWILAIYQFMHPLCP